MLDAFSRKVVSADAKGAAIGSEDLAKGIKSFKKGMSTDSTEDSEPKNISDNQDSNNKD